MQIELEDVNQIEWGETIQEGEYKGRRKIIVHMGGTEKLEIFLYGFADALRDEYERWQREMDEARVAELEERYSGMEEGVEEPGGGYRHG